MRTWVGAACNPSIHGRGASASARAPLHACLRRFVRETGHFTLCTVCEALKGPELVALAPEIAPAIADGMSDNWSQVGPLSVWRGVFFACGAWR